MKKYALHPGFVNSKNDRQAHYISVAQLVGLYGLKTSDCVGWDDAVPETYMGRNENDFIHLWARDGGDYKEHMEKLKATEPSKGQGEIPK